MAAVVEDVSGLEFEAVQRMGFVEPGAFDHSELDVETLIFVYGDGSAGILLFTVTAAEFPTPIDSFEDTVQLVSPEEVIAAAESGDEVLLATSVVGDEQSEAPEYAAVRGELELSVEAIEDGGPYKISIAVDGEYGESVGNPFDGGAISSRKV